MFDARTIFTLFVSFLTDFFAGLITGLGGGVLATTGTDAVVALPGKAVWVFAIMGALVAALRGLQKNLAEPVASPNMMRLRRASQAVDRGVDRTVAAADAAGVGVTVRGGN